MRFLHLADLHLGKRLNDVDLIEDQKHVLKQAIELADEVEGVLVCGDVYDKSVPSAEAMTLFDWFISKLAEKNKKVYIIYGNHDSDQRISYFSSLLEKNSVFVSRVFDGKLQSYESSDEYGDLCIHLFPFVKPVIVKRYYPDEEINSYEDAVRCVISHSEIDRSKRNIILAHQFITGSERSESEEVMVGGLDNIDAYAFDDFDYVALGHIHKPQAVKRESLRYSGSILKYSFSESVQKKSFCIVDVREKGNVSIETRPIDFLHDVVVKEGMLDELMNEPYSEDYAKIILNDEEVYPDSRIRLLTVFPNMMKFAISNSKTKQEMDISINGEYENKSIPELFIDFYRMQNNNVEPTKQQLDLLNEVLENMQEGHK